MLRRLALVAVLAGLVAAPQAALARKANPRLHAFGNCTSMLRYVHHHGARLDPTRYGGIGGGGAGGGIPVQAPSGSGGVAPETAPAPPSPVSDTTSPTNVQEAGVDEPDIVKAAGTTVYAINGLTLRAIDASTSPPRVVGSLGLGRYGGELLVHGDRALVLSADSNGPIVAARARAAQVAVGAPILQWSSKTVMTEVDISDPSAMKIVRTMTVDGNYLSARLNGATARVVIGSSPRGLAVEGAPPGVSQQAMTRTYRRSVQRSRVANWLPRGTLRDRRTGKRSTRSLLGCRQVKRAQVFSGLDTITVLTIDMDKGLPAVDADALMTDGDTVYASQDKLYVASERWLGYAPTRTEIAGLAATGLHAFDISTPDQTTYAGSGEVPGFILNQWSLSERGGILRVATTDRPATATGQQESALRTLELEHGRLVQLGIVGGLGQGERIYGVRYIDDTAFVVTFRQIDPLFTVDLSDPRAPRLVGQLQLPGYSSYLHPVGDGLLLGLGQDADASGHPLGLKLTLFDVSDLAHPARLSTRTIGSNAYSPAESDHHAFLWWAPQSLAVLPVQIFDENAGRQAFSGAIAFRVTRAGGVQEAARLPHPPQSSGYAGLFDRSVVIGDRLLELSDAGVLSTSVAEPGPGDFVAYGG
jgi:uncharacterized secreted protein with C-terminal beta-propeller domain